MVTALHDLTIGEASRLIRARELSPVELTRALLSRIDRFDRSICAFITVTADLALGQAAAAERDIAAGRYRGALHGIPFALKDLYNTAGVLTSANSKLCAANVPAEDATAVSRLYEAGAVLIGKLKTHEFAQGGPATDLPWPPARNPWNVEHFTGGSSSGSAAAVAARFVPAALGTDTGGSIRGPAALCGIVGLRPTYGLVSRYGAIPNSFTFDACGPMTRTVEDCAIVLQAIAGYDRRDPSSVNSAVPDYRAALSGGLQGLRIGVVRHFWEDDLPAHADVREAMESSLAVLRDLGATLDVIRMRPLQDYYDVRNVIALSELMSIQHRDLIERTADYSMDMLGRGLAAALFQSVDYVEAQRERRRMVAEMQPLYERYDGFVTAASPAPAPRLDAYRTIGYWQRPNITTPFSISGSPALVVCNGFAGNGLPLGMQIAARPFGEQTVFRIGHAFERAAGFASRAPSLSIEPAKPVSIESAPSGSDIDESTRKVVRVLAERAGLDLNDRHFELLCQAAPYAFAMSARIRKRRDRFDEPANVFRCG